MAKKSMKKRLKARQRKLEQRRRKRAQAHSREASPTARPTRLRAQLQEAGQWPLEDCLLTQGWQQPGEIIQILIARRSPWGQIAAGVFLVDLGCLGVKNAFASMFDSRSGYRKLRNHIRRDQTLVTADPDLVAKIVREGLVYARRLGFEPNPDYREAMLVLGDANADACDLPIPLGKDGKPFFISGPYDNIPLIMSKLEKAVGSGGFYYMLGFEEQDGVFG